MLFANHPVADIINAGLTINNEFYVSVIKDDTKMWFRAFDKEFAHARTWWKHINMFEQMFELTVHIKRKYKFIVLYILSCQQG